MLTVLSLLQPMPSSSDSKAEGLGISQLGVVDLEKGTFIAFDREGYGNLYEEGIGWSNDSTVTCILYYIIILSKYHSPYPDVQIFPPKETVIEGFTWQTGDEFMPSPSGNKLLYYSSDSKAEGLGISQLGVVDLEKGTFIAFDREGYGNLYEEGITP